MADPGKKPADDALYSETKPQDIAIEYDHAQFHKISPEDDARIRLKIDMVVLPMVRRYQV
jgi:hypothetical protein